jgi:hypothetical protein
MRMWCVYVAVSLALVALMGATVAPAGPPRQLTAESAPAR